jgi:hypothetical protein
MADPRETARAWLVEVLSDVDCTYGPYPCAECAADAILLADGVVVEEQVIYERLDWNSCELGPPKVAAMRGVIRLPARPVGETP